jgi:UDP-2,3-diacylglucosamine pyrophosphatase LpxH
MIYDTVFISDLHLGTDRCNADALLEFLSTVKTKKLVLVGDVLDVACLEKGSRWNRKHTLIVHRLLEKSANGCQIIYIYGNHEKDLCRYKGILNGIIFCQEYVHTDSKGANYLCIHGDKMSRLSSGDWKQFFLHKGYELITPLNHFLKKTLGISLVNFLKKTKRGRSYIDAYENDVIAGLKIKELIHCQKFTGAIVGHIHHLNRRVIGDYQYYCCGDWVDTCSAILEINGNYVPYWFEA